MGFLNHSLGQVRELFASMTPAARITAALLLGVTVVSLGYLFQGYAGASEEYLFNAELLQPREADYVEAAIAKKGLTVLSRKEGRIVVPRGQKSVYLAAIAEGNALPRDFDRLLEDSLSSGFMESGDTKKARIKAAREKQLSMMVSEMRGIDKANVLYDVGSPHGFEKAKVTSTVSVLPEAGSTLEPHQGKLIREAIAGAILGLEPENVTIFDQSTGSEISSATLAGSAFDDPYHQARLAYEGKLKRNIEDLLNFIQPTAHVQVSAELDPTTTAEIETVRPDGEVATIRETTDKQDTSNTQVEDKGRPGLVANGPNGPAAEEAVAKNENTTSKESTDVTNFVPHMRETRREMGLTPKVVRASISIPSDYLMRVWRERTPDAAPDAKPDPTILEQIEEQTKAKIKATVANQLPQQTTENIQSYVEVTVFQSLTPPPRPEPSLASEGLFFVKSHAGSLLMAGMALMCLLMLRSMVKSIPAADTSLAFRAPVLPDVVEQAPRAAASAAAESSPAGPKSARPRLQLKKGPTLKDDLTELVKEDPEAAAAILRTWIGNAA